MIRCALRLLLVNCLWLVPVTVPAAVPANPLLVGDSIFVSQQGVYRFDLVSGKTLWSSLPGIETFEPVAIADLILVGSTQVSSDIGK